MPCATLQLRSIVQKERVYIHSDFSFEAVASREAGNEENDKDHHQNEHGQENLYFDVVQPHLTAELPSCRLKLICLHAKSSISLIEYY